MRVNELIEKLKTCKLKQPDYISSDELYQANHYDYQDILMLKYLVGDNFYIPIHITDFVHKVWYEYGNRPEDSQSILTTLSEIFHMCVGVLEVMERIVDK